MSTAASSRSPEMGGGQVAPGRADEVAVDLRCSVLVIKHQSILLLHRTRFPTADHPLDWVLPGGRPQQGESLIACARREALEETGLDVAVRRCWFVLEVASPETDHRVVELIFAADPTTGARPHSRETDRQADFVPLDKLGTLRLSPPIAGYVRGLRTQGAAGAAYLGNLWRPDDGAWPW